MSVRFVAYRRTLLALSGFMLITFLFSYSERFFVVFFLPFFCSRHKCINETMSDAMTRVSNQFHAHSNGIDRLEKYVKDNMSMIKEIGSKLHSHLMDPPRPYKGLAENMVGRLVEQKSDTVDEAGICSSSTGTVPHKRGKQVPHVRRSLRRVTRRKRFTQLHELTNNGAQKCMHIELPCPRCRRSTCCYRIGTSNSTQTPVAYNPRAHPCHATPIKETGRCTR